MRRSVSRSPSIDHHLQVREDQYPDQFQYFEHQDPTANAS